MSSPAAFAARACFDATMRPASSSASNANSGAPQMLMPCAL
jgi:hypothetical protein